MLIVDTGVLVAATDRSDHAHRRCLELLQSAATPLVTTALVIAECAYLIERELGPDVEALLFKSIVDRQLHVEDLKLPDWQRTHSPKVSNEDHPTIFKELMPIPFN